MTEPPTTLAECLNLRDFELAAEATLKPKAWAYYSSAGDDCDSKDKNSSIWADVVFRPRVLVNVEKVDTNTAILGQKCSMPVMISPAAMGKLAHKDGEKCLVRGAGRSKIHYGVSTHASCSHKELAETTLEGQTLFFQLYMNTDRVKSAKALNEARKLGYKAIIVTVDTPWAGNRELDLRTGLDAASIALVNPLAKVGEKTSSVAASGATIDASLNWKDLAWIKETSQLPLVVKGIQSVEDAILAVKYGAAAIMLSNHGGRQIDTTATPLETLLEIRHYAPEVLSQVEVIVDGGIRRGTDAVKAYCLGAKAVSLGRPYMYSLIFGDEGVYQLTEIMRDEIERTMRLLGAKSLADLKPSMVNARRVESKMFRTSKL